MRCKFLFPLVFLSTLAPGLAAAQTVAVHQTAAPAAAPAAAPTPAKGPAIIPGSPLAVLTGAGQPAATPPATAPATDADNASPYGTASLGLSITSVIGTATARTVSGFVAAVNQSTRLTPVLQWLKSVPNIPSRRAHAMDVATALAIIVGPALLAELLLYFILIRLRSSLVLRAQHRLPLSAPAPAPAPQPAEPAPAKGPEAADKKQSKKSDFVGWLRRLAYGLLYFLLRLLPLVAFALTAGVLLGLGLVTTRQAKLAVIGAANAYLLCRLILEFSRFLLAPNTSALRLIAMPDQRAKKILRWLRVLLASIAVGYVVVSICEILGLSHDGTLVIARLAALVVHVEVAIAIWHSRRVVAGWIAGDAKSKGMGAMFRHWIASVWHYLALFYILALWIALAGGVQHAFTLLLRIVLVLLAASVVARMAWNGANYCLDRLLPDTASATGAANRHAGVIARARAYNPFIRVVVRTCIIIAMLIAILQGWGVPAFAWLLSNPFSRSLLSAFIAILITLALAALLWEVANAFVNNRIDHLASLGRTRQASRLRTLLPMMRATLGVAIGLVAGLICLSKIGVNAAPLLAGAGVLSIAIAFGSQKLVQDIITGLFLLLEDAMQVGDVVNLASMTGTVEKLSIRTIRLRGGDGSVNIIPFSAVTTVTNMTRDFSYAQISIQVSYEEDLDRVYALLTDISRTMRAEPAWGAMMRDDLQIFGLDQFGVSALVITGQIRTGPGQHWAVRREFQARVKQRFEDEHIEMPYTYLPPAPPKPAVQPPAALPAPQEQVAEGLASQNANDRNTKPPVS